WRFFYVIVRTTGSLAFEAMSPIMKSLFLLVHSALIIQLSRCDASSFSDLADLFNPHAPNGLVVGNLSGVGEGLGSLAHIVSRQRFCVDPGYGNPLLVFASSHLAKI